MPISTKSAERSSEIVLAATETAEKLIAACPIRPDVSHEVFVELLIREISRYPREVMDELFAPRVGVPQRLPPGCKMEIGDVSRGLEAAQERIAYRRWLDAQEELKKSAPPPRVYQRGTVEEINASLAVRYPGVRISARPKRISSDKKTTRLRIEAAERLRKSVITTQDT